MPSGRATRRRAAVYFGCRRVSAALFPTDLDPDELERKQTNERDMAWHRLRMQVSHTRTALTPQLAHAAVRTGPAVC